MKNITNQKLLTILICVGLNMLMEQHTVASYHRIEYTPVEINPESRAAFNERQEQRDQQEKRVIAYRKTDGKPTKPENYERERAAVGPQPTFDGVVTNKQGPRVPLHLLMPAQPGAPNDNAYTSFPDPETTKTTTVDQTNSLSPNGKNTPSSVSKENESTTKAETNPAQGSEDNQTAQTPITFEVIEKSRLQKFVDWVQRILTISDESKATAKLKNNASLIAPKTYDPTQDRALEKNFETLSTEQKQRVFNAWLKTREDFYTAKIEKIKRGTIDHTRESLPSLIAPIKKLLKDEILQATRTMQHFLPQGHILVPVRQPNNSFTFNIVDLSKIHKDKPLEGQIIHKIHTWRNLDPALQHEILTTLKIKDAYVKETTAYRKKLDDDIEFFKQRKQEKIDKENNIKASVQLPEHGTPLDQAKKSIKEQLFKNTDFQALDTMTKEKIMNEKKREFQEREKKLNKIKASVQLPEYLNWQPEAVQKHIEKQLINNTDFQNLKPSEKTTIINDLMQQSQQRDTDAQKLIDETKLPSPDITETDAYGDIEKSLMQQPSYKNMPSAIQLDIVGLILSKWQKTIPPEKIQTEDEARESKVKESVDYSKLSSDQQKTFDQNFQKAVKILKEKQSIDQILKALKEEAALIPSMDKRTSGIDPSDETLSDKDQTDSIILEAIKNLESQDGVLTKKLETVATSPKTLLEPGILADSPATSPKTTETTAQSAASDFLAKNKQELAQLVADRQARRGRQLIETTRLPDSTLTKEQAETAIWDELEKQKNYMSLDFDIQTNVRNAILEKWIKTRNPIKVATQPSMLEVVTNAVRSFVAPTTSDVDTKPVSKGDATTVSKDVVPKSSNAAKGSNVATRTPAAKRSSFASSMLTGGTLRNPNSINVGLNRFLSV